MASSKAEKRRKRHRRVRKKVIGMPERPRLCIFKSSSHIYAQIIDDMSGLTLVSAASVEKDVRGAEGHKGNVGTAKVIGGMIGKRALDKGIKKVVLDRGGFIYHGRVKALADAARETGLEF